jgi:N-acetylglutamate synthase-like GNAT family acetyltransferase
MDSSVAAGHNSPVETARAHPAPPESVVMRAARFEDVPAILRLIDRAVDRGCARDYDLAQRRAVFLSYGRHLFIETLERFELIAADRDGTLVGAAQLDPADGRLRALFVDGPWQGRGLGAALLAEIETRAARHRLPRLHGAMSLNAVPFYTRQGFRPCAGPTQLTGRIVVPVVPMEKRLPAHGGRPGVL